MRRLLLSTALSSLLCLPAFAQESLGAHEHGAATMSLAIDGGDFEAVLTLTSFDVLGFGTPETEEQEAMAMAKVETLENETVTLLFPAAAGCVIADKHVHFTGSDDHDDHKDEHGDHGDPKDKHAGHDDHDEHDHDEHGEGFVHADFEIEISGTCATPAALDMITINMAGMSSSIEHVELEAIINGAAMTAEIEADAPTISLK